ncbi:unnamed protein product [Closterium sp. Yama58-4]|nr:unnamed protein product [Closterium sp. Yama58-4]
MAVAVSARSHQVSSSLPADYAATALNVSSNPSRSLHDAASSFADLVLGASSNRAVPEAGPDGHSASHAASHAGIPRQSAAREVASPEADLSAQLSVADLLTCLSRIEERSEQVKAEIIQEVEGRHEELRQLMWHACQAGDDVAVLLAEVDALAASVSPTEATEFGRRGREGGGNHAPGSGPASATGSGTGLGSGAALGFVEEVVRATNEVRALNEAANEKAEIRKAVEEIVQLQKKQAEMQGGEEEQGEEPVVVTLLRQQVDASCKQLQHSLEQQLWQMLVIDPSSHSIRIVTSAALTSASTASAPVVHLPEGGTISGSGSGGSSIRLQRLAAALWPRMADSIIERCLALAVPQETRELARFQEVVEVTRAFETALRAEGFLAPLPKASAALKEMKLRAGGAAKRAAAPVGDRLMAYAADVDVHFAEKKRVAALAANNSVFYWEPCHVSEPVCKILEIVHNTMEEASQSTDLVTAPSLFLLVPSFPMAMAMIAANIRLLLSPFGLSYYVTFPCRFFLPSLLPLCSIIPNGNGNDSSQRPPAAEARLPFLLRGIFLLLPFLSDCSLIPTHPSQAAYGRGTAGNDSSQPPPTAELSNVCLSHSHPSLPSNDSSQPPLTARPVDVAQLAMIAINDRLLLSHVCLSLALQYRARLPAGVRHVATFADVAPFLRQLAEEQMQRVLERHHGYLMEALDGAQGFRNTDEEEVYRCALRALKQAVHHLAHLSSVWRPVSPPSRYLRAMSRLVSAVLSRCCAHVLALPDISVDETEQLRKLFAGMLTRLPPLFHVGLSGAISSAHGATSASVAAAADLDADVSDAVADTATLESLVPVYRKLKRLTDLLDMPLVAITQAWESGDLCRCGFTSDEVQQTIRAIFSDTPLRRNCTARVAATMPPTAFQ